MSAGSAATDQPGPLVLVADDDPDIRGLVAGHLERRGYSVVAARDGEEALGLARERVPQVAVLDVGMPGLDGLDVAAGLLEVASRDEIGVIFLTARVQDEDVARGYDAGARAYIKKPFSLRELTEAVERVLGERALRLRADANRALAREQAALARLATAVAGGGEPEAVCALVAREVAALLGASEVAVVRGSGRPPSPWVLSAPVWVGERIWGALVVRPMPGVPVDAEAAGGLRRFADLVGLCLSSAQRHDELVTRATIDHLTGLPNARAFHERLEAEIRRARREGAPLSLVLMDVDHFKRVNDGHGHEAGDLVLAEVARRLAAIARTGEMVARVGGEEFAWILPGADGRGAFAAADRGRAAVEAVPVAPAGRITVSAGVCELGTGTDTAAALFRGADGALYAAKARGRNRCVGAAA